MKMTKKHRIFAKKAANRILNKRFLEIWCKEQLVGTDDVGGTGIQLLCCAHLVEGHCFVCPYTPDDIQKDGNIYNVNGYKDEDFKSEQKGIDAWKNEN